ncbi:MAG: hypothetical protein QXY24_03590 [Candidatus Aenigmatarchaeota archaeon]
MDKREIVEFFMKKGIILKPDVLEYLVNKKGEIKQILEKIDNVEKIPPLISIEFLKNLLEEKKVDVEEVKKEILDKKIISVDDVSSVLIQRYEKIKSFFTFRMDLVNLISINKINEKMKKFSLIVMVREIDEMENKIVVEDLTGEIIFHVKNKGIMDYLIEDEVVGVVCERNDGRIEVVNILWPDIPLKRNIGKLEEDVFCLFCNFTIFEENYEKILDKLKEMSFDKLSIFLFSDVDVNEKYIDKFKSFLPFNSSLILITKNRNFKEEDVLSFSPPVFLRLEKKINLLLSTGNDLEFYKSKWGKGDLVMLNLLKKRHLNPIFKTQNLALENNFIIDPIPDIFVVGPFDSPFVLNYKGTTLISCGTSEKIFWIVNLKTRENLKIDLI